MANILHNIKAENVTYNLGTVHYIVGNTGGTAGTWTGSDPSITEYFDGLTIAYKIGTAGLSDGTKLNINNLGAVTVVKNATTGISTSYPVNSIVFLVYTTDGTSAYWKATDYDANTRNSVGDYQQNNTKLYLAGTKTTDASTSSSYATSYTNKDVYIGSDNYLYDIGGKVAHIPLAVCDTDKDTSAKVATVVDDGSFILETGSMVLVKFTHGSSVMQTLNINNTGAKSLEHPDVSSLPANEYVLFMYDGSYWIQPITHGWRFKQGKLEYYGNNHNDDFSISYSGIFYNNDVTQTSWRLSFPQSSGTVITDATLANGSTAGAIKTTSTVTSNSGYTACPVINGVPYYRDTDTNTDTKTSSANTDSKIYLIGATSQSSAGVTTYSHDTVYIDSSGALLVNNNVGTDARYVRVYPNGTIYICSGGGEVTTITASSIAPGTGGIIAFNELATHADRIASLESQLSGLATALEELHSGS